MVGADAVLSFLGKVHLIMPFHRLSVIRVRIQSIYLIFFLTFQRRYISV